MSLVSESPRCWSRNQCAEVYGTSMAFTMVRMDGERQHRVTRQESQPNQPMESRWEGFGGADSRRPTRRCEGERWLHRLSLEEDLRLLLMRSLDESTIFEERETVPSCAQHRWLDSFESADGASV